MNIRDANRIVVINKHCNEIIDVLNKHNYSRQEFDDNVEYKNSILFSLLQIGESVNGFTDEFLKQNKDIKIREIIATRNSIVHGYAKLKIDIIWDTCVKDIPVLIKQITKIAKDNSISLEYRYSKV